MVKTACSLPILMRVTILGTSAGIPIPGRAQSGVLVELKETNILMDCGMGVPLRLVESGHQPKDIDLICLTHEHLDHIQDVPALIKSSRLTGLEKSFEFIVPTGLSKKLIKIWKSLEEYEKMKVCFKEIDPGEEVNKSFKIETFNTSHTDMSIGYKILKDDKSIIYTGDTAPCEELRRSIEGADLLIHELSKKQESEGHTSPESLIPTIQKLNIGELILTHFYPEVESEIDEISKKIERETGILTKAGKDLTSLEI